MFGQRIFAIRRNKSCTNDGEGKAPENISLFFDQICILLAYFIVTSMSGSYRKDRQTPHYTARNYNILNQYKIHSPASYNSLEVNL